MEIKKFQYGGPGYFRNLTPKDIDEGTKLVATGFNKVMGLIGNAFSSFLGSMAVPTGSATGANVYANSPLYRTNLKALKPGKEAVEKTSVYLSPSSHVAAWTQGSINPKVGAEVLSRDSRLQALGVIGDIIALKYAPKAVRATPVAVDKALATTGNKGAKGRVVAREMDKTFTPLKAPFEWLDNIKVVENPAQQITYPWLLFNSRYSRFQLPNGKIRLLLPSHTEAKPRLLVLDPKGNNKYYVHMRAWDDVDKKVPATMSSAEKNTLFEALYNELPDGSEILFPQSGPGNYGTRGTVAGLLRLSRDSRFQPGTPGTLYYKGKNNEVQTYQGTSFIKKPEKPTVYRTSAKNYKNWIYGDKPIVSIDDPNVAFIELRSHPDGHATVAKRHLVDENGKDLTFTFDTNTNRDNLLLLEFDDSHGNKSYTLDEVNQILLTPLKPGSKRMMWEGSDIAKNPRPITFRDITPLLADLLIDFIEKNKGKNVYVHCLRGTSRSGAVDKFLGDYYGYSRPETKSTAGYSLELYQELVLAYNRRHGSDARDPQYVYNHGEIPYKRYVELVALELKNRGMTVERTSLDNISEQPRKFIYDQGFEPIYTILPDKKLKAFGKETIRRFLNFGVDVDNTMGELPIYGKLPIRKLLELNAGRNSYLGYFYEPKALGMYNRRTGTSIVDPGGHPIILNASNETLSTMLHERNMHGSLQLLTPLMWKLYEDFVDKALPKDKAEIRNVNGKPVIFMTKPDKSKTPIHSGSVKREEARATLGEVIDHLYDKAHTKAKSTNPTILREDMEGLRPYFEDIVDNIDVNELKQILENTNSYGKAYAEHGPNNNLNFFKELKELLKVAPIALPFIFKLHD